MGVSLYSLLKGLTTVRENSYWCTNPPISCDSFAVELMLYPLVNVAKVRSSAYAQISTVETVGLGKSCVNRLGYITVPAAPRLAVIDIGKLLTMRDVARPTSNKVEQVSLIVP